MGLFSISKLCKWHLVDTSNVDIYIKKLDQENVWWIFDTYCVIRVHFYGEFIRIVEMLQIFIFLKIKYNINHYYKSNKFMILGLEFSRYICDMTHILLKFDIAELPTR